MSKETVNKLDELIRLVQFVSSKTVAEIASDSGYNAKYLSTSITEDKQTVYDKVKKTYFQQIVRKLKSTLEEYETGKATASVQEGSAEVIRSTFQELRVLLAECEVHVANVLHKSGSVPLGNFPAQIALKVSKKGTRKN